MAMLAEPRRKQKWSIDPRNSTWSKDDSKFGQKMLEKMGWSKGKGLGAQEQGCTEHVKVQVKNNTMGLGASVHHEDNWIAHQDDFNQLLAELNDCHGTASSDSPANDSKKSFSLEEKSKSSKKRVHYMKFAKGKDLSSRSDTDLACIFGKREKGKKSGQDEAVADSEESEEKEPDTPSPKNEVELGNTVISSLSVNEYFAKRMAQLKKSQSRHTEASQQSPGASPSDSMDGSAEPKRKSKKKKKRSRSDGENDSDPVEGTAHERRKPKSNKDGGESAEEQEEPEHAQEEPEHAQEEPEHAQEEPEHAQEEKLKRKKRKNKRKKETLDLIENDDSPLPTEEPKKKKKKKQQKSDD